MRASGEGCSSSGAPSIGTNASMARVIAERQGDAQHAAGEGQQQALGEELPHQLTPGGAERQPDGDLPLAHEGAGDQQVGDVGAGDEQHQADHAHQHDERHREVVADRRVADVGLGDEQLALQELLADVGREVLGARAASSRTRGSG